MTDIQSYLGAILSFINDTILPFLMVVAFVFFLWNTYKYFIAESDSEDGREKAKRFALWGIIAFVFIVSLWGIVNLLVRDLGFGGQGPLTPDFMM